LFIPLIDDYDLTKEANVIRMYDDMAPTVIIHLAAEVGGIGANQANPGRFFYANMAMGLHLIEHARLREIKKFVQIGTICAYPKFTPVPFREENLWEGYPEETNAPYGIAKKSLLVMLQAYRQQYGLNGIYLLPVNLYGLSANSAMLLIPEQKKWYSGVAVRSAESFYMSRMLLAELQWLLKITMALNRSILEQGLK